MMAFHSLRWTGALGAVLASFLLTACGGDRAASDAELGDRRPPSLAKGPELEPRGESAPRAAAEQPRQFAYSRYWVDVSGDAPEVCLGFNKPLSATADYSSYVRIDPETPIAIKADGTSLCLGGLAFGANRQITLLKGLPSADGDQLALAEVLPVEFGDRPSFVGFKGSGVILPRIEADGLPIETVNVETVEVQVQRITDRALAFKSITTGYNAGAGDWAWLGDNEDPWNVGESIWQGRMDTPGPVNAAVTTVFPIAETIGQLEPGAYFVSVKQWREDELYEGDVARAKRWLIITDLAMTAYEGEDSFDVVVRSLQSAKAQAGVRVDLIAGSNEILASAETDQAGRVRFEGPIVRGEGPTAPRMLMSYADNGDFALLDLSRAPVDLSGHDVAGRTPPHGADAFIYADRGVYRPGETVRAVTLIRDGEGRAIEDRAGSLIVYAPSGVEQFRHRFEKADEAGSVALDYTTPSQAARGRWRMVAELDGLGIVGETGFGVEDFVPQRVKLELDANTETPMRERETRAIEADVRFLYGAPGAGLPIEATARIETDPNPFPNHRGFRFGLHDEQFVQTAFDLAATTADGAGEAVLELAPNPRDAQSSKPLRVRTVVTVFEPGGRPVSDDVRIPLRPSPVYLGLKPDFEYSAEEGRPVRFDVIAAGADGSLKRAELDWRLLRIDWDYDWYRESGGQWRWRRTRNVVEVDKGVVAVPEGSSAALETRALDWGDYELRVTDKSTGVEASQAFWAGWGGRAESGVEAPDRVRIAAPAEPVKVGGQAEFTILPPYAGEAEIVVASDRVLAARSISVSEEGATVSLPVTEEWGAGAYVMVSVFTPRDPVAMPRPRRAVGVAYAPVDVSERTFDLAITAPDVVKPRQTLTVEVAAESGPIREDAYVTVAAVDEGILLLTKFETPDPADWFFGKRALGVDLMDDYGRLIDPNQGAAAPVRSGADSIGGAGLTVVPTKTVALFSGLVELDGRGRAQIKLDIPDFNGELRLMAVAFSDTGVGSASQALTVRDDVPAELILPRFLAPGDEAFLTASLDNVAGEAGAYRANITAGGPLAAQAELAMDLAQGEREDASARISASAQGVGQVSLNVEGPGGFKIERSYPIQARSPYLPASIVERRKLEPAASYSPPANMLASFVEGSGDVRVSFSPIPMDPAALYDSLDRYPYGCTEQLVSRAMPLLYADQMAALAQREGSPIIRTRLQEATATILNRQGSDGAIGLWRMGDRNATPWLGAYATDFLARAKEAGYPVPEAALEQAYEALTPVAQQSSWLSVGYDNEVWTSRWNPDTKEKLIRRSAAYAHYVLARAGKARPSDLRYLHDEGLGSMDSPLALAHLGAALTYIGDNARAASAFSAAEKALGYVNEGDYYQTTRRDLAGVLALAAEAGRGDLVDRLAERVAEDLPEPDRLTTQEKAFLLLAAHALTGDAETLSVRVEGKAMTLAEGRSYALTEEELSSGPSFTNRNRSPIWMTAVARGAPESAPPPAAEELAVEKLIARRDGSPADLSAIEQGDQLVVAITLTPQRQREMPMIIADLLPAGFEIEAILRPGDAGDSGPYGWLGRLAFTSVAEARDDRFVAAVTLRDQQPATVAYLVRAVTPGQFAMPGAVAEDMYRPEAFARSAAGRVSIAEAS